VAATVKSRLYSNRGAILGLFLGGLLGPLVARFLQ
jgi:hypothetical protein